MQLRAAIRTVSAHLGSRNGDMNAAIAFDLSHQLLVEFAFEFPDFPAAKAGDMNMVPRPMTLVKMSLTAKVKQVELVDQAMPFQKVDGAVDSDASDARINFLSSPEDVARVEMAPGSLHHLKQDAALPCEANPARRKLPLQPPGWFVDVDSFAGGNAVCRARGHRQ